MTNNTTPSYQEMINAIYEKIADKALSLGCKVIIQYMNSDPEEEVTVSDYIENSDYIKTTFYGVVLLSYMKKIIGHPVMIGDVLDYFEKNNFTKFKRILGIMGNDVNFDKSLAMIWLEKRKPIEEQSDECIEFVYNLISE